MLKVTLKALATAALVFVALLVLDDLWSYFGIQVMREIGLATLAISMGFLLLIGGGLVKLWSGRRVRSVVLTGLVMFVAGNVWLEVLADSPEMQIAREERMWDQLEDMLGYDIRR